MQQTAPLSLSPETVVSLKKITAAKTYATDTPLHYQGQIPIAGYLILKGNILLTKNDVVCEQLTEGCLWGCRELFYNIPSSFGAEVKSSSEICYLDKSTLLEIKNSEILELNQLYAEITHSINPE